MNVADELLGLAEQVAVFNDLEERHLYVIIVSFAFFSVHFKRTKSVRPMASVSRCRKLPGHLFSCSSHESVVCAYLRSFRGCGMFSFAKDKKKVG